MFEFDAGVLAGNIVAVSSERHVTVKYVRADNYSASVRACLPRRIFEFAGDVDDSSYIMVGVVHFDEFGHRKIDAVVFVRLFRVIQSEHLHQNIRTFKVERLAFRVRFRHLIRDRLGYAVGLRVREFKHASHVLYGVFGRHGSERDYLANAVVTVLAAHVFDNFLTARILEVHVEVGCGNAFGVKETLEVKVVFQRIDIRDSDKVRDYRARARTAPGTYRYAHITGGVYVVPHDKEVFDEALLFDDREFAFDTVADLLRFRAVFLFYSLVDEFSDIRFGIVARNRLVMREHIMPVNEPEIAFFRHFERIVDRVDIRRKRAYHFFAAFEVEFVVAEFKAIRVVVVRAHLHAHKHVLRNGVLARNVMNVVGRNRLYSVLFRVKTKVLIYFFLFGKIVVLQFEIKILAENAPIPLHQPFRLVEIAV